MCISMCISTHTHIYSCIHPNLLSAKAAFVKALTIILFPEATHSAPCFTKLTGARLCPWVGT